jgi:hypothetical protein
VESLSNARSTCPARMTDVPLSIFNMSKPIFHLISAETACTPLTVEGYGQNVNPG